MNNISGETHRIRDKLETHITEKDASCTKVYIKRIVGPKRTTYAEINLIAQKKMYDTFMALDDDDTRVDDYDHRQLEVDYGKKYYNEEALNAVIWDDTFEITRTQKSIKKGNKLIIYIYIYIK